MRLLRGTMQIQTLDHVNIRTNQLGKMIDWYTRILGLKNGWRPDFPFGGAWLYAGDAAVIHLVEIPDGPAIGSEVDLKLEHFAFTATGAGLFQSRLEAAGESFKSVVLPDTGVTAFNVWDPDGNHIHVDFKTEATD